MADTSAYPGALDGDLRPLVDAGTAPSEMEDAFQLVFDAVTKIQVELGTNPSGAAATVAAAIASALTAAGTSFTPAGTIAATTVQAAIEEVAAEAGGGGGYAPLDSPAFTGTPTAPTPAAGDSSTKVATTAFVAGGVGVFVGVKGTKSATQSIASGGAGATPLTFNTEEYDTHGFHDPVTNSHRFTIPAGQAGYYQFSGHAQWASDVGGLRQLYISKNGAGAVRDTGTSTEETNNIAWEGYLNVGDYVELGAYQFNDDSSAVNVLAATWAALHCLGR